MKTLIYVTIFWSGIVMAQDSPEQIAFDYFFENVFEHEFNNQKVKLKFSGKTQNSTTGIFTGIDCLDEKENLKLLNLGFLENTEISIDKRDYIKNIRSQGKNGKKVKYKLLIYNSIKVKNGNMILIQLYRKRIISKYYYVVIDNNNEVIDLCKTSSIH